jgi:FeS assembly SUF system regulator
MVLVIPSRRLRYPESMLRISKLTDYATVVLAALAEQPEQLRTAAALAARTGIAAPTVSKLLKQLHRAGLLTSTRGLHGGYQLGRAPSQITVAAILDALEGPIALTDCSGGHGQCGIEHNCRVAPVWQRLNAAIRRALSDVTLAELAGLDAVQPRLPILEHEIKFAARHD